MPSWRNRSSFSRRSRSYSLTVSLMVVRSRKNDDDRGDRSQEKGLAVMRFTLAATVVLFSATLLPAATLQNPPRRPKEPTNLRVLHGEHYRIHTDLDRSL